MQPFHLAEQVQDTYYQYIRSSFPLRNPAVQDEFERLVRQDHLLWRDPFISLARPFRPGGAMHDLIAEGVLSPAVLKANWRFQNLFAHQAAAARRLSTFQHSPQNTLVATGTGSGKTESFLIPIVEHCLRQVQSGQAANGVQAIILYPMNALVNDQLERLRVLLKGTGVRFGRYTGDTPRNAQDAQSKGVLPPDDMPEEEVYYRDEYRTRRPHILLTNYVMLELLLMHKGDRQLFGDTRPRFLVLDEVHTFTGILGAEVACLIRRLKEHAGLQPGELICVGTSATAKSTDPRPGLSPEQAEASARDQLAQFATALFAESFTTDSVITERYLPVNYPPVRLVDPPPHLSSDEVVGINPDDPVTIHRLAERTLSITLTAEGDAVYEALHNLCAQRTLFAVLEDRLRSPRPLSEVITLLAEQPERATVPENELRTEATALLILGAVAQQRLGQADPEPRFRPAVHLLVRSLAPLNRCLRPDCGRLQTDNRLECHHEQLPMPPDAAATLPLGICRSCGADYFMANFVPPVREGRGRKPGKLNVTDLGRLNLLPVAPDDGAAQTLYLYAQATADLVLDEEGEPETTINTQVYGVCPHCRRAIPAGDAAATLTCDNPQCSNHQGEPLPRFLAFLGGSKCPLCQAQGKGRKPEIITQLRSGAAASVSVLAQALLPKLGNHSFDPARRLLIFADSRQDTAHQAGYLRDRHQVFTQRQIVYQTLRQHEADGNDPIPLPKLAQEVFVATRNERGETEAFNLLTPIAYKTADQAGFLEPGQAISAGQTKLAIDRLRWDVSLEFTDRATTRYSLEREGLTTVVYSRLDEIAAAALPDLASYGFTQPDHLATFCRAFLDYWRLRKAVDYEPFRHYLGDKSDWLLRNLARPTRYNRTPVAVDKVSLKRGGAYEVFKLYNTSNPGQHHTGLYNLAARALPHLQPNQVTGLIDDLVKLFDQKGFLRRVTIGQLWKQRGALTAQGWQLHENFLEVTTTGNRYRCPTCGTTRGYLLRAGGTGQPLCATYRCKGVPEPYTLNPDENFYVAFYASGQPERLYPMEHSGQLTAEERVVTERKFKENLVNTLVCTPTLELGVDIGDLAALIMRNVPPTPSNYAQRAGRAGRRRRIALILSHSGQGPHDSYFFDHPDEMISGAIRPPVFLLDNRVVIDRHLNSLILEKLSATVPGRWADIRTDEGELRLEVLEPFTTELAQRSGQIQAAVEAAFVHDKTHGGLAWLTASHVRARLDAFVPGLQMGLAHWCRRYREIYAELRRSRAKVRPTDADRAREGKLTTALDRLENDQQYYPLSYLATVGFLPRYGFPGDLVTITDDQQRQITQGAAIGITEYAPGNLVYVGGRKLEIDRILFRGGSKEDPRQNADTYYYCTQCNYVAIREPEDDAPLLVIECDYCHQPLSQARYVPYEAAHGQDRESITQEDEYRAREDYELVSYLRPRTGPADTQDVTLTLAGWNIAYSRLRSIELFNRGQRDRLRGGLVPTVVCLECGNWQEAKEGNAGDTPGRGHAPWCTVPTWDAALDDRVVENLHLRAHLQGDVIEIPLSPLVGGNAAWMETLAQALKLGMQLELFIGSGEINSFIRQWEEAGQKRYALVLYDTMPGGTGYLKRLVDEFPLIAARAARHLDGCGCEKACYRCLMEFRNQRQHHLFDKRLVLSTLHTLAAAEPERTAVAIPDEETRFDSFLESRFYALLAEHGLPLPKTQQVIRSRDGRHIARADFCYEDKRILILTDGRQFHTQTIAQIQKDITQRNKLTQEGWRLLEFTYADVLHRPEQVVWLMRVALGLEVMEGEVRVVAAADPLPPHLAEMASRYTSAHGYRQNIHLELPSGQSLSALACREASRQAIVWVAVNTWIQDNQIWQSELDVANQLRLLGWQLVRMFLP